MEHLGSLKGKFLEAGLRDLYFETQEEVVEQKQNLISSLSPDILTPKP